MAAKKKTTTKYGNGGTPGTEYVINKYKKDGSLKKHKSISKNKFDRVSNRYAKQDGSKSLGTSTSRGEQVISGRNSNNSVSRSNPMKFFREGAETRKAEMLNTLPKAQKIGEPQAYPAYRSVSKSLKNAFDKSDKKEAKRKVKVQKVIEKSRELWDKSNQSNISKKKSDRLKDRSIKKVLKEGI